MTKPWQQMKIWSFAKSYLLLLSIAILMLCQLFVVSTIFHLGFILNPIHNIFITSHFDTEMLGSYFVFSILICCAIWFLYRPVIMSFLILKNKTYFSGFISSWLVTKNSFTDKSSVRLNKSSNQYFWIYRLAKKMAKKLNVAAPDIAIDGSLNINAKVLPEFFHPSLIILSRGLLHKLTPDEIEAVMAHELAHVAMRDTYTMSGIYILMMLTVWLPVYILHLAIDYVLLYKWRDKGIGFVISLATVVVSYALLALLVFNSVNRRYELRADKLAMKYANSRSFVSALKTIHCTESQIPNTMELCLLALPKSIQVFVLRMFLTHPSIQARIQALE